MKRRFYILPLIWVAMAVLAACGPNRAVMNVEMSEFKFIPEDYSVPAGAEVTLNLKNAGMLEHSFIVMKAGVKIAAPFSALDHANIYYEQMVPAHDSLSVKFTAPDEAGDYQIICGIPGHLEQGMQARLHVSE